MHHSLKNRKDDQTKNCMATTTKIGTIGPFLHVREDWQLGPTEEEHLQTLTEVLRRLDEADVRAHS